MIHFFNSLNILYVYSAKFRFICLAYFLYPLKVDLSCTYLKVVFGNAQVHLCIAISLQPSSSRTTSLAQPDVCPPPLSELQIIFSVFILATVIVGFMYFFIVFSFYWDKDKDFFGDLGHLSKYENAKMRTSARVERKAKLAWALPRRVGCLWSDAS